MRKIEGSLEVESIGACYMLILTFTNIQNREIIFKNQLVFGPMPDGCSEWHLVTNSSVPDEVR